MGADGARRWCTAEIAAPEPWHFARVLVGKLGKESGEGEPGLNPKARTKHQAFQATMIQHVEAVDIYDMAAVRV